MIVGREHPTDMLLAQMVTDVKAKPLYPVIQSQRVCERECLVIDNFAAIRSMFV